MSCKQWFYENVSVYDKYITNKSALKKVCLDMIHDTLLLSALNYAASYNLV